jgi:hypothetical protein
MQNAWTGGPMPRILLFILEFSVGPALARGIFTISRHWEDTIMPSHGLTFFTATGHAHRR